MRKEAASADDAFKIPSLWILPDFSRTGVPAGAPAPFPTSAATSWDAPAAGQTSGDGFFGDAFGGSSSSPAFSSVPAPAPAVAAATSWDAPAAGQTSGDGFFGDAFGGSSSSPAPAPAPASFLSSAPQSSTSFGASNISFGDRSVDENILRDAVATLRCNDPVLKGEFRLLTSESLHVAARVLR